ncbi:MAG: sulfatase-like hydrolase/transferase, partial [Bryobacterales bacterium]|nr:sulfatase-like hydrolase/transferase [Bryobacterales bacterium]
MPSTLRMHAALVAALLAAVASGPAAARPNILFLLLDDMGYADTGAYGNTYHRTPNIDRLAREGVRFTDAYAAAPNCSPTRASILTGMWPARTGLTQYLPGNVLPHARLLQADLPLGLPLDSTVVAQPLSGAGYATACVGKWHLGAGGGAPHPPPGGPHGGGRPGRGGGPARAKLRKKK